MDEPVAYYVPHTVPEALEALAAPAARVLAGGTDFYAALGERPVDFDIVDITRIAALKGIAPTAEGGWRIGAAATWSDLCRADLPAVFGGLKAAAREVGAIQIQNSATLAGNLCNASPAADGVPALLTLDAEVELDGPAGARRLPLSAFLTGPRRTALAPGELLTAILVPPQPAGARSAFGKLGARRYLVISIAMVSVVLHEAEGHVAAARVAVGACSAVAQRLPDLEAALADLPLGAVAAAPHSAHFAGLSPIDDVRASADYRREAALELTRRTLARAAAHPAAEAA